MLNPPRSVRLQSRSTTSASTRIGPLICARASAVRMGRWGEPITPCRQTLHTVALDWLA
jgi:hypothetical protein